jgi:hypothetical protein
MAGSPAEAGCRLTIASETPISPLCKLPHPRFELDLEIFEFSKIF